MRPNIQKLCNMLEWERPSTQKKIQRYLGILTYFRRFIPNASELIWPIKRISKRTFKWYEQPGAEEAYQKIFHTLITRGPFLAFPTKNVVIQLATDASNHGIGATLFQIVNDRPQYLGFHSRALRDSEKRYTVPKKELIAIVYHVKYYRDLLWGKPFILWTDSEALTKMLRENSKKKPNTTIAAWLAELSEYEFEVRHISGKENVLPDLASRVQSVQVINQEETDQLLRKVHAIGHWGTSLMSEHVLRTLGRGDIENLREKCQTIKNQCDICSRVDAGKQIFAPPREPEYLLPMQYLHMDLMDVQESKEGYNFILVIIDQMSKFVWLIPLRTKTMNEVSTNVLSVFLEFGFPEKIKTDNGTEFENHMVRNITDVAKISHNKIIAHDHHANGLVERAIKSARTILNKLIRATDEEELSWNWEMVVPAVQFAMNNTVKRELGTTPFEIMFGRSAFQKVIVTKQEANKALEARELFWKLYRKVVPTRVWQARVNQWSQMKYPHNTGTLQVGDWVMHKIHNARKDEDQFYGPFKVTGTTKEGHYILGADQEKAVAPRNFLKICDPLEHDGPWWPVDKEPIADQSELAEAPELQMLESGAHEDQILCLKDVNEKADKKISRFDRLMIPKSAKRGVRKDYSRLAKGLE